MQFIPNLPINIKDNISFTTTKLPSSYTYNRYKHSELGTNHKAHEVISNIAVVFLLIIISIVFVKGFDKRIESQDIMLCESALISKNAEYLRKCQCYYQSDDIKCLQNY